MYKITDKNDNAALLMAEEITVATRNGTITMDMITSALPTLQAATPETAGILREVLYKAAERVTGRKRPNPYI